MAIQDDYTVRLSTFEGPLDLLLYLIRRAEVDIHDIPIVEITDQFLTAIATLGNDDRLDIDAAGEFLVMAATLVELKSRTLSPKNAEGDVESDQGDEEADDPRHELVRQLLAYQRYRSAAGRLDDRREEFAARWPVRIRIGEAAAEEDADETPALELDDVHAGDLFSAFERIMAAIDPTRLGEHEVEYDDTPIGLHSEDLLDRMSHAPDGKLSLQAAFEGRSRGAMIGLFLAVLELARQRRVLVRQEDTGLIHLELNGDVDDGLMQFDDSED
ncbi:MAG: segregation/condensation protein A [Phycisphaerales bacterium]|jgi:segregation and condensation protein A|nr:segregation/condensation protein A [Phycisphaerales bacterium]